MRGFIERLTAANVNDIRQSLLPLCLGITRRLHRPRRPFWKPCCLREGGVEMFAVLSGFYLTKSNLTVPRSFALHKQASKNVTLLSATCSSTLKVSSAGFFDLYLSSAGLHSRSLSQMDGQSILVEVSQLLQSQVHNTWFSLFLTYANSQIHIPFGSNSKSG